jgi:para-aminobenzoate synthetase component 1
MRNYLYLTNKSEAIGWLNKWGTDYTPFLFIIDFEMKKIRVFRLDKDLPSWVRYDFSGYLNQHSEGAKNKIDIQKSPVPFNEYERAFKLVSQHIQAGNSFLVNLTMSTHVKTGLTFADLYEMSHARYKLWLEDEFICFSPEPFIRISKGKISTYPMKGTIAGNLPNAEEMILSDKKETAEHHTVIDLLRNDMSMVARNVAVESRGAEGRRWPARHHH